MTIDHTNPNDAGIALDPGELLLSSSLTELLYGAGIHNAQEVAYRLFTELEFLADAGDLA